MSKNGNPFCSKLLHFAHRCQCSCKAKCSNYYILQRYYIWVASSVGMPHPLHMFYGNLGQLGKKSNSVIRPRSVTVKNWCNVLSMEGVTVCGHHPECRVTFGRGGPHIVW